MNTTTERIEAVLPRSGMTVHAAEMWQIIKDERGYFVREWFDVNKLTTAEREEYDAFMLWEPPEAFDDGEYDAYLDDQWPRFPTLALAREWAQLCDEESNVDDDMRAFNAPGECYKDAHRSIEARKRDLLELSDRPVDEGEGPYGPYGYSDR